MYLKTFTDPYSNHPSYLIGCEQTGDAMVIDPSADITPYLREARRANLTINHVAQTRIHGNYLSGEWALASATDSALYVSGQRAFAAPIHPDEPVVISVSDGDMWLVGNLRVRVVEIMGCDPDHITLLITDSTDHDRPLGAFSGGLMVTEHAS
jgi:hydroxyacylglutathione hydrolase